MSLFSLVRSRIQQLKDENPEAPRFEYYKVFIIGIIRVFAAKIYLRKCTAVGRLVSVRGKPIIVNLGEMTLGDEVRIWSKIEKTKLYTGRHGKLTIGKNTRLNGVHIDACELVQIGDNVRIAPYTVILDSDFHDIKNHFEKGKSKPIIIEDNVWLATRCTILKGVRIGKGSVVAAGAVVTKNIPPNCVAAGVPAIVIKEL